MENKYFTRDIKEGTVKRTHFLSTDPTVKLEMLVQKSGKVIDSVVKTKNEQDIRLQNFKARMDGLRVNGLPIIYEDLGICFDSDEIMEVAAFINGGDMSVFLETGDIKIPDEEKNA